MSEISADQVERLEGAEPRTPFKVLSLPERENLGILCRLAENQGRLRVLGPIDGILREDYLDESLPLPDRAIRNIRVSPDTFRAAALKTCDAIADAVIAKKGSDIAVVYPWRAGLAFLPSFFKRGVRLHIHSGLSRDEHTLQPRSYLAVNEEKMHQARKKSVVTADPMLATAGSMLHTVEGITRNRIPSQRITLASVISAPEGIAKVLRSAMYPGVEVITHALDSHLNELGFIQPGLGDFGDKFFEGLTPEFFEPYREAFTPEEWEMLRKRLANEIKI
jgi:uracil phosphoribosyltransferase